MHFSDNSEEIMECFIDKFEEYMKKKTTNVEKNRLDTILLSLYHDITASSNFIEYIYNNVKPKIQKYPHKKQKELFTSHYMPKKIIQEIKENEIGSLNYETRLKGRKIKIHFIIFDEK